MFLLRILGWLAIVVLVVAAISEGVYLLLGNEMLGRLVCTAALIAVVPVFIKLFNIIVKGNRNG